MVALVSAKFHYTDGTRPNKTLSETRVVDPAKTRQSLRTCRKPGSPTNSGRARLVEFGFTARAVNGSLGLRRYKNSVFVHGL